MPAAARSSRFHCWVAGVVDLKGTEARIGIAVGEGVEAGAEKNVLGGAGGDGCGKHVLGEAATGDDPGAKSYGVNAIGVCRSAAELLGVACAEDGDGKRVREDERVTIDALVCGAAESDAKCSARRTGEHTLKPEGGMPVPTMRMTGVGAATERALPVTGSLAQRCEPAHRDKATTAESLPKKDLHQIRPA